MDSAKTAQQAFTTCLQGKLQGLYGSAQGLGRINKVSGELFGLKLGVELQQPKSRVPGVKALITALASQHRMLLLLDEVQVLAQHAHSQQFVAALCTALDMHKDQVEVIFMGSSRTGLQQMFAAASAPFFHFGQNLNFAELDQRFTNHLANVFAATTNRTLDQNALWQVFEDLGKVPHLIRALVERVALNPGLAI